MTSLRGTLPEDRNNGKLSNDHFHIMGTARQLDREVTEFETTARIKHYRVGFTIAACMK